MTSTNIPSPSVTAPAPSPFSIRITRLESSLEQSPDSSQPTLELPNEGFGPVYVGEKIRTLVHVSATETMSDIVISLYMRASIPDILLFKSDIINQMSDEDSRDLIIEYDIASPGLHQIVCNIDYTEIDSSLQSVYSRMFKFQVHPPFTSSHWVSNILTKYLFSFELTNLIPAGVNISSIQFSLNSSSAASMSTDFTIEDQFDSEVILNENESFCTTSIITWNRSSDTEIPPCSLSGRFEIHWKHLASDDSGGLFKSPMINFVSPEDLKVTVTRAPSRAHLEAIFPIHLLITNASQIDRNDLRIEFVKDRLSYLRPSGSASHVIGKMLQGSSLQHSIDIVGLATGIHALNGIRLVCPSTARVYDFDQLCSIEIIR